MLSIICYLFKHELPVIYSSLVSPSNVHQILLTVSYLLPISGLHLTILLCISHLLISGLHNYYLQLHICCRYLHSMLSTFLVSSPDMPCLLSTFSYSMPIHGLASSFLVFSYLQCMLSTTSYLLATFASYIIYTIYLAHTCVLSSFLISTACNLQFTLPSESDLAVLFTSSVRGSHNPTSPMLPVSCRLLRPRTHQFHDIVPPSILRGAISRCCLPLGRRETLQSCY